MTVLQSSAQLISRIMFICSMFMVRFSAIYATEGDSGNTPLSERDTQLLQYCAEGLLDELKEFCNDCQIYLYHTNWNCLDSLDRSPLSLAVINGHAHIVKYILELEIGTYILQYPLSFNFLSCFDGHLCMFK